MTSQTNQRSFGSPYISVVVTSRNDDHGGNLLRRMQFFIDGWVHQARKFDLPSEIVLVEWNPPTDRPPLAQALRWPADKGPCQIRLIEVPAPIHHRFKHADRLPLFQFIAKNAGIRRAWGDFVLATNIDILFSDELMAFLAKRQLREDVLYRNDRIDIPADIPADASPPEALAFCARNMLRVNMQSCTINLQTGFIHMNDLFMLDAVSVGITDILKNTGGLIARSPEMLGLTAKLLAGPRPDSLRHRLRHVGQLMVAPLRMIGLTARKGMQTMRNVRQMRRLLPPIHTNACGDFTLMATKNWLSVRGHPEYQGYSMHIDSLLLMGAIYGGLVREEVLPYPMRHYHIEHGAGSGFTPEYETELFDRLRAKGIPWLEWNDCWRYAKAFKESGKRVQLNDEDWGLEKDVLRETIV